MKLFNLISTILFTLFAALQYNDPDPYIWIPIYGYAAVLTGLASKGRYYTKAMIAGITVYVLYAAVLFVLPDGVIDWYEKYDSENLVQSMKATKPWIEYTREFGGLLMLILVLSIDLFRAPKISEG